MNSFVATIIILPILLIVYIMIGVWWGNKYYSQTEYPYWKEEPLIYRLLFRNILVSRIIYVIIRIFGKDKYN